MAHPTKPKRVIATTAVPARNFVRRRLDPGEDAGREVDGKECEDTTPKPK
jgi:hypothetical protein